MQAEVTSIDKQTKPMSSSKIVNAETKPFQCPYCPKPPFDNWPSLRGHALGAHHVRLREEDFGIEIGAKPERKPGEELTFEEEEAKEFKTKRQRETEAAKFYKARREKEREIRRYVQQHPEILDELGVPPRRIGYGEYGYRGEDELTGLGKMRIYESIADYYDSKKRAIERDSFYTQPETKNSPEVKAVQEQLSKASEDLAEASKKIEELEKQREADRWERLDKRLDSIEKKQETSKSEREALVVTVKETADVIKTTVTELKPVIKVIGKEGARSYRLIKALERAKIEDELEKRGIEVKEEAEEAPGLEEAEETSSGVISYVDKSYVEEE